MMRETSLLIILFNLLLTKADSARILGVFPTPSISHQVVFRKLVDGLVQRGHQVTVITTDPAYPAGQAPNNLTEVDLHDISYKIWKKELLRGPVGNRHDTYNQLNVMIRAGTKVLKHQLKNEKIQDIINKKTDEYDLLLIEAWLKPTLIFSHIFKKPVILVSSMGAMDYNLRFIGASTHPLLYPWMIHQKLYDLTNWEKIQELYQHFRLDWFFNQVEKEDDATLKTIFGPNTPSIAELYNNVDMLFLNVHPIWTENQPMPPSVVYMGGIHTSVPKELPKDLQNYLDSSKNGVIYFSLGTNVIPSLLPPEKIEMLKKVFSQLPYDVMWKWDKDELPGISENVKIFKWLPQSGILRHPKIKLFITQGGLQSTDEAIIAGVPLIGMPMLGDQWYNVEKYRRHKIGLRLDLESLTEDEFKRAILTVINDKGFRKNVVRMRTIMGDQPQSPLERAIWWTEYVLRHGGAKHLRAAGANISWAEYLELQLLLLLVFFLAVVLTSLFIIIKLLSSMFYRTNIKMKTF